MAGLINYPKANPKEILGNFFESQSPEPVDSFSEDAVTLYQIVVLLVQANPFYQPDPSLFETPLRYLLPPTLLEWSSFAAEENTLFAADQILYELDWQYHFSPRVNVSHN